MKFIYNGQELQLGGADGIPAKAISYADYQALPEEEKNAAVLYLVTDAPERQPLSVSVEDYDTDDGWHVRKYSDGYVEMDYTFERTVPAGQSASGWHNDIAANGVIWYKALDPKPYPIPLVSVYAIDLILSATSGGHSLDMTHSQNYNSRLTSLGTCFLIAMGTAVPSAANTVVITAHVTGRWK